MTVDLGRLSPGDLPSAPAIALRVIEACGRPEPDVRELVRIVSADTALHAELLRIVNSPYFGLGHTVTTATQAVVVLGQRALRNLALVFAVREVVRSGQLPGFDVQSYWEDTLRRAVSARELARHLGMSQDEAFTVGMLQDLGMLAMFLAYPEHAPSWERLRLSDPSERHERERDLFATTHDQVGAALAKRWFLPEALSFAIAAHHSGVYEELDVEAAAWGRVATGADWMAAVFGAADKRLALARCRKHLRDLIQVDHAGADALLAGIPSQVSDMAQALGISVKPQIPFAEVLRDANRELVTATLKHDTPEPELARALEQRDRLVAELQQAYDRLAQLAYFDSLTALVNRRRFEEVCVAEFTRHFRSHRPMSLVMLDLDGFKQINDAYGHPFGDEVLRKVAQALRATLRCSDVAARVGGEELCVLLPETDAPGGLIAAERSREAIAALNLHGPGGDVRVTASFGGVTWQFEGGSSPAPDFQSLLGAADAALYRAKHQGRNQVCWA